MLSAQSSLRKGVSLGYWDYAERNSNLKDLKDLSKVKFLTFFSLPKE